MEEVNKYWMDEKDGMFKLYGKGKDCMEHFIEDCGIAKGWFNHLGKDKKEIIGRVCSNEIDEEKGKAIVKLWEEKNRIAEWKRKGEKGG